MLVHGIVLLILLTSEPSIRQSVGQSTDSQVGPRVEQKTTTHRSSSTESAASSHASPLGVKNAAKSRSASGESTGGRTAFPLLHLAPSREEHLRLPWPHDEARVLRPRPSVDTALGFGFFPTTRRLYIEGPDQTRRTPVVLSLLPVEPEDNQTDHVLGLPWPHVRPSSVPSFARLPALLSLPGPLIELIPAPITTLKSTLHVRPTVSYRRSTTRLSRTTPLHSTKPRPTDPPPSTTLPPETTETSGPPSIRFVRPQSPWALTNRASSTMKTHEQGEKTNLPPVNPTSWLSQFSTVRNQYFEYLMKRTEKTMLSQQSGDNRKKLKDHDTRHLEVLDGYLESPSPLPTLKFTLARTSDQLNVPTETFRKDGSIGRDMSPEPSVNVDWNETWSSSNSPLPYQLQVHWRAYSGQLNRSRPTKKPRGKYIGLDKLCELALKASPQRAGPSIEKLKGLNKTDFCASDRVQIESSPVSCRVSKKDPKTLYIMILMERSSPANNNVIHSEVSKPNESNKGTKVVSTDKDEFIAQQIGAVLKSLLQVHSEKFKSQKEQTTKPSPPSLSMQFVRPLLTSYPQRSSDHTNRSVPRLHTAESKAETSTDASKIGYLPVTRKLTVQPEKAWDLLRADCLKHPLQDERRCEPVPGLPLFWVKGPEMPSPTFLPSLPLLLAKSIESSKESSTVPSADGLRLAPDRVYELLNTFVLPTPKPKNALSDPVPRIPCVLIRGPIAHPSKAYPPPAVYTRPGDPLTLSPPPQQFVRILDGMFPWPVPAEGGPSEGCLGQPTRDSYVLLYRASPYDYVPKNMSPIDGAPAAVSFSSS